jgi:hypothetical protein
LLVVRRRAAGFSCARAASATGLGGADPDVQLILRGGGAELEVELGYRLGTSAWAWDTPLRAHALIRKGFIDSGV